MIVNEQDIRVYHGDPGSIVADPLSVLNLFDQDAIPHMQSTNSSASGALIDHKGYFCTFSVELDIIAKMENLVQRGNLFIHLLYSHRSVSEAIPEIATDSFEKKGDDYDGRSELSNRKSDVNTKIMDILRPEMRKIRDLHDFVTQATTTLHGCLQHIQHKDAHKEVTPSELNFALIHLLDILIILDHLRDMKLPCLSKDFSRFKKVAGSQPPLDISEDIAALGVFLSHSDPRNSEGFIFRQLRSELKRIGGHEKIILDTAELAADALHANADSHFHQYFTPEEKFRLLRAIPHLLLIADGSMEDPKSFSVFKTSRIQLAPLQQLLRAYPVLPVYGDVSTSVEQLLQRSGHYQRDAARGLWTNEDDPLTIAAHDICSHWEEARDCYTQFTAQLAATVAGLSAEGEGSFQRTLSEANIHRSKDVFQLVTAGCQHLARWTATLQQVLAWKYLHPYPSEHLVDLKLSYEQIHAEGIEYGCALRYNLTSREMSVLVDFILMVKSMSASLQKAESLFAPYIRFHVHHRIQELVQRDLTPLLHRLDKRNKPILPSLLKLRSLAADWLNGHEPRKDYREYSRKHQSQSMSHPARVVGATDTQLFILRAQVRALCDSSSEVRKKSSVFGKADLEASDVQVFEQFYRESFFFRYLLGLSSTLRCVSNLGDLWFREGFLQATGCIQFPIELSLPWILTEHLISSPNRVINPPMMQNVLYVLDIYNDAAHSALYVQNVQFFYDEIEAELNLVIDQLYFLLSEEVYSYFKNLAASTLMEQSYKNKMEEVAPTSTQHLWVEASRIEHLLGQRNVQLLGRSVNLTFILTQHLNNKLRRDVEFAISRFESSDARGVVDLTVLLNILSDMHHRLSAHVHLDPFPHILHEINNHSGKGHHGSSTLCVSGRIARHMYVSLQRDIAPNFSYNAHTQRFVPSPIAIRPFGTEDRKPPKQAAILQAYGLHCGKAFEFSAKLTRGFFGSAHWDAYFSLDSSVSLVARLISDLLRGMFDNIRQLAEYIDALKANIPTCKAPLDFFRSPPEEAYGYFESKLRSLLAFDDLKPEVFQLFREVGNILSVFKDLSDRFELTDQFDSLHLRHLLPMYVGAGKQKEAPDSSEMSPVEAVITALSNAALQSDGKPQSWVRCSESLRKLPGIVSSLVEGAHTATTASTIGAADEGPSSSGTLFQWVLVQLEEFLYQQQLMRDWSPSPSRIGSAQGESSLGFQQLWSVLSFLFCITESVDTLSHSTDSPTQREQGDVEASDQRSTITNEAEFGHGFCFAGCVLLHILGQRAAFELRDFSRLVLQIHSQHEVGKVLAQQRQPFLLSSGANNSQASSPLNDAILVRDAASFLEQARSNQRLQGEMLARLEAAYCPRSSYRIAPLVKYHPPRSKT